MQSKFVDITSETLAVNSKIANKAFDYGIEASKNLGQEFTGQAEKLLGVKTVNDFVAVQTDWFENLVGHAKNASQVMFDLGAEANASYNSIWKNYGDVAAPIVVAKQPGRKPAGK